MANYYEVDKGRFEAGLVRSSENCFSDDVIVAYTDGDVVKKTLYYIESVDRVAVEEFAEQYGIEEIN